MTALLIAKKGHGDQHLCLRCRAFDWEPERLGENHLAARWGDYCTRVFLDGIDVANDCVEAFAGREGYVVLIHREMCEGGCGRTCEYALDGVVSVERTQ